MREDPGSTEQTPSNQAFTTSVAACDEALIQRVESNPLEVSTKKMETPESWFWRPIMRRRLHHLKPAPTAPTAGIRTPPARHRRPDPRRPTPPFPGRGRGVALLLVLPVVLPGLLGGCSQYTPFDSVAHLRQEMATRLAAEAAAGEGEIELTAAELEVPFALSPEIVATLDATLRAPPREAYRVEQVLDFIFRRLELEYSLLPTRDAVETYRAREGNCLSFVHLFVGLARHQRLDPFYVEVVDHQRWRHENGMVLSQGHIVAGLYLGGRLETYDFLPYRPKSYKELTPIDDLTATAHHYNNLGAEALLAGDAQRAERLLATAVALAPHFPKALNNLGVVRARRGDRTGALAAYRRGLEVAAGDVPLLSNLARLHQQMGELEEAAVALARIDDVKTTNPFYFVYRGELELARGDAAAALEHMRRAFRLDSELPEVHVGLASVYLALGEVERARHHVERALRLDATHGEARRLAVALAAGDGVAAAAAGAEGGR